MRYIKLAMAALNVASLAASTLPALATGVKKTVNILRGKKDVPSE